MTARVLVVDDIKANVKLLEARLSAEYFEILTAYSGPEALEVCEVERIDVILLDVMMPGMDGFEVCERLKRNPKTQHIPVVMVTALDTPSDRLHGLEAGADDFLTKPVDDVALVTRVKNLARLKMLTDEMTMRAETGNQMGLSQETTPIFSERKWAGKVLIVEDNQRSADRMTKNLIKEHSIEIEHNPQEALFKLAEQEYDLLVISLDLNGVDGLRLASQVRSLERTRSLPILIIVNPEDKARLMRGLDMGVNDYMVRPICANEMMARVNTQVRRKKYTDYLRNCLETKVELAVTDALTGLHNRHYLESHLKTLFDEANSQRKSLSVLMTDIDYFKSVNDTYGHDVGDLVLKEFARRIRTNIRGMDLACRIGGEEFVIVMPDTSLTECYNVAERLRKSIEMEQFHIPQLDKPLDITTSIGITSLDKDIKDTDLLMKRADQALYCAKRDGRNRVAADAA
ncbi:MAG: PleD family two-component system response regulator [Methyloligella sp.]|nr:MAG: PleD family two-component system response regulator [Methyloligella sp.]